MSYSCIECGNKTDDNESFDGFCIDCQQCNKCENPDKCKDCKKGVVKWTDLNYIK
jgi:hypothetical protein